MFDKKMQYGTGPCEWFVCNKNKNNFQKGNQASSKIRNSVSAESYREQLLPDGSAFSKGDK
jgi:hypothetical protein